MSGLEGVVAAETRLSDVDGAAGQLIICGHSLDQLDGWSFEDMAALMLGEVFPDAPAPGQFRLRLSQARQDVFAIIGDHAAAAARLSPVEAVRLLLAALPDGEDMDTALQLLAAPAVFTPAILRLRDGHDPVAPDPGLSHAADVLRMMQGQSVQDEVARALDTYLVTVCDHGLNASTFAARVVASTRAGYTSAVMAGISALKGPLHGGAPGPVIEMLDEIGAPDRAEAWIEAALDRGERLMGFGHRIYRVRDPRADALKRALRRLAASRGAASGRLKLAETVEMVALPALRRRKPDRALETNVEFYTALLLEALRFPPDSFTCVFAMGRTLGWLAHAAEQVQSGRLIRPQSRYVGARPSDAA